MSEQANEGESELHERLEQAAAGKTYRWIAKATNAHPETVRRYMQGATPNIEFVTAFCNVFSINPQWLLSGEGPMRRDEVRGYHLAEADPSDLLAAIAAMLDRLTDRLDRLELYCQQLESRLMQDPLDAGATQTRDAAIEPKPDEGQPTKPTTAGRIGKAVAKRSPPDAP
ncbi:MAG: hypothetical protein AAGB48_01180 [Planctomycetota bacterium]